MSLPKQIKYGKEGREALLAGVNKNANAVKVTLGAGGRLAVINEYMRPVITTQDGVTLSKKIKLSDPFEDAGNQLIQHAAQRTMDEAGDGTTTATILAQYMIQEGFNAIESGMSPMKLKAEIEAGVKEVVAQIKKQSRQISISDEKEIRQVALVAAKGDEEIASLVTEAVIAAGKEGIVNIGEANSYKSEVKTATGARLPKGFGQWRHFINNPQKATCEFENPYVLISEKRITSVKDILPIMGKIFEAGASLLVICEEAEGEALGTMVTNRQNKNLKIGYVQVPGIGSERIEWLQDIAILTGTKVYGPNHTNKPLLADLKLTDLGQAKRVTVSDGTTIIVSNEENAMAMEVRVADVRKQLESAEDEGQKQQIKNRLALISGGIAVINIGGATDIEVKERKDRVDDAVRATQSALEEGIVAGGGCCLNNCTSVNSSILEGATVIPMQQIKINAGFVRKVCLWEEILKFFFGKPCIGEVSMDTGSFFWKGKPFESNVEFISHKGLNVRTGETGNMFEMGIIDSAKVVRSAFENAASVAIQFICTEVVIIEEEPKAQ